MPTERELAVRLANEILSGLASRGLAVCEAWPGNERNEWQGLEHNEASRALADILRGKTSVKSFPSADAAINHLTETLGKGDENL